MSTRIRWAEMSEHLNYDTEYYTICYCTERPVDVFMRLCRTHEIYRYKDMFSPMESVSSGLYIDEGKPPKGCIVIATLQDVLSLLEEAALKKEKTLESIKTVIVENKKHYEYLCKECHPWLESEISSLEEVIDALEKIIQKES